MGNRAKIQSVQILLTHPVRISIGVFRFDCSKERRDDSRRVEILARVGEETGDGFLSIIQLRKKL